jgi:dienelactone hydrolase
VLFLASCSVDSLLFQPVKLTGGYLRPEDIKPEWRVRFIIPDSLIEMVTLTSQGERIYGLYVLPGGQDTFAGRVTVIYSHGSGGNMNGYWGRVEFLWEMGYRVFAYDYHGYGMSEGQPTSDACYADGEAALDYCLGRPDTDTSRIVYYGLSMGTFMSVQLATDVRTPAAVILEAPVATTASYVSEGTLLDLPDSLTAHVGFDNEGRIGRVKAPLFLLAGKKDRDRAHFDRNALGLYRLCDTSRTEHLWLEEGDHDNIPWIMGSDYPATITDFVRRAIVSRRPSVATKVVISR